MKRALMALLVGVLLVLGGCNAVAGLGRDMTIIATEVGNSVDDDRR